MKDFHNSFQIISQTESTNKYATGLLHKGMAGHGLAVFALEQTAGRGRRGKKWLSEAGQNIVLSIVLQPFASSGLPLFAINIAASLACIDLLWPIVKDTVRIKWPNDIFLYDRKAAGILAENTFSGANWQWCVAGIGMNINQTHFETDARSPVSLKMVTGKDFDVIGLARELHRHVLQRFNQLNPEMYPSLVQEYNTHLYGRDRLVKLKSAGKIFKTKICGVSPDGVLQTADVFERSFSLDEVEFRGMAED